MAYGTDPLEMALRCKQQGSGEALYRLLRLVPQTVAYGYGDTVETFRWYFGRWIKFDRCSQPAFVGQSRFRLMASRLAGDSFENQSRYCFYRPASGWPVLFAMKK